MQTVWNELATKKSKVSGPWLTLLLSNVQLRTFQDKKLLHIEREIHLVAATVNKQEQKLSAPDV